MIVFPIRVTRYFAKNKWFGGVLAVAMIVSGLMAGPAEGVLLQGPHVLTLMAEKMGHARTLRVEQQVFFEDANVADKQLVLNEILYFLFPDKIRSEMVYKDTQRIQVVSGEQALTIVDNKITRDTTGRFDRYRELLLNNSSIRLQKCLALGGIDVGIVSFGRHDFGVYYVIGARYPDETVSQLWVDKDDFLPLRWLTLQPGDENNPKAGRWEFIYTGWQKVQDIFYPFKIETLHNGKRIRLIRVHKVEVNASVDSKLFNINLLKSEFPVEEHKSPSEIDSSSDAKSSEIDEVQRAIEEFKKKFEP